MFLNKAEILVCDVDSVIVAGRTGIPCTPGNRTDRRQQVDIGVLPSFWSDLDISKLKIVTLYKSHELKIISIQ